MLDELTLNYHSGKNILYVRIKFNVKNKYRCDYGDMLSNVRIRFGIAFVFQDLCNSYSKILPDTCKLALVFVVNVKGYAGQDDATTPHVSIKEDRKKANY